jgi:hypothetical protein
LERHNPAVKKAKPPYIAITSKKANSIQRLLIRAVKDKMPVLLVSGEFVGWVWDKTEA